MRLVRKVLGKGDYWTKYRRLYDQGKFDLKSKKRFLEDWFEDELGYFPDIDHPRTFNEKVQWMKLYYDDPSIARCIDKVTFKDYIGEALGKDYVVPAIKAYGSAEKVDFRELPGRFVAKANYGSCAKEVLVVRDKAAMDEEGARRTMAGWSKPWWRSAWGGYEHVQPKILVEEYIEQLDGQVYDYKVWCFNGRPRYVVVSSDRFVEHRIDWYDLDWRKQDLAYLDPPASAKDIERPRNLERMLDVSRRLSSPFPFVRVDFYDLGDRLYIGELTFYPDGGMGQFNRKEYDLMLGEMLELPERRV